MGIPYYFVSLLKQHKGILQRVRTKLEPDIFAIDFNCLVHNYLQDERPIDSILEALEKILQETCSPRKFLYIAMDGVVPYAKIVQQRYRRFLIRENSGTFDRHQISPGTPYMRELASAIQSKFSNAIVSSTLEEGEGEHKIFQWLKTLPSDQRRSVCIYGLDADLILLSIAQKNLAKPRCLWLLRENQTFQQRDTTPGFSTLSVGGIELPIPDLQYIFLSTMCFGNDFVPPLGMFSLREGGYERALKVYKDAGCPDLLTQDGRKQFVREASKQEMKFYERAIQERNFEIETSILSRDTLHFETRYNLHIQDGVKDVSKVVESYWKIVAWTFQYFTENSIADWSFYYAYPEAPLLCQLSRFGESTHAFKNTGAWSTTRQLQFILPKKSIHSAKKRCIFPDELYEEKNVRHYWMRKYAWESEPRISLPNEEDLTSVQICQLT